MESKKMKIFETVKMYLASIEIYENKCPFHRNQILHVVQGFLALILQCMYLVCDANTVIDGMNSISMTAIGILVYTSYWSAIFKTANIYYFIDHLETIINGRLKHPKSKAIYENTNQLVEKFCKFIQFTILYLVVSAYVLPKAIYSFFMYFITDLGPDAFELPIPTWFPFDWKNPIGYSIAVLLQLKIVAIPLRDIGCFVSFGSASFLFAMSLAKDLKGDIRAINENARKKRSRKHIPEHLKGLIRFMCIKRLITYCADIFQIILIIMFLGVFLGILLAMLMIQIELAQVNEEIDSLVLFESIALCFSAISLLLFACEIGERLSNAINGIAYLFSQLNFYLLPVEVNRILPIIIIYVQEPCSIRFFGSLSCSREQFKKVINILYQYYMILRKFYK